MNAEVIFGVNYHHLQLSNGADLYITEFGEPILESILPENFYTDREWFDSHHVKLPGTSNPYRVMTKNVSGQTTEVVLKSNGWGRKSVEKRRMEATSTAPSSILRSRSLPC